MVKIVFGVLDPEHCSYWELMVVWLIISWLKFNETREISKYLPACISKHQFLSYQHPRRTLDFLIRHLHPSKRYMIGQGNNREGQDRNKSANILLGLDMSSLAWKVYGIRKIWKKFQPVNIGINDDPQYSPVMGSAGIARTVSLWPLRTSTLGIRTVMIRSSG